MSHNHHCIHLLNALGNVTDSPLLFPLTALSTVSHLLDAIDSGLISPHTILDIITPQFALIVKLGKLVIR